LFAAQHPHGVLAMKTDHCDELIQNAGFPATLAISVCSRTATTSSSRVAMVTRLILASTPEYQSGAN
jgi:hypothetical protein